jgi:hypothetical protein
VRRQEGSVSYTLGDWLTIVQHAGQASGHDVQIVRATPVPADAVTDPAVVTEAVESWQRGLLAAPPDTDVVLDGKFRLAVFSSSRSRQRA